MRNCSIWLAIFCVSVAAGGAANASPIARGHSVFYLALAPGQCAIRTLGSKTLLVVPCSDARHNFEVYSIEHGGWRHGTVLAVEGSRAVVLCRTAYRRITGHLLSGTSGMTAFWADPGSEETRYGDKVICSVQHWPNLAPLGSGSHIRHARPAYTA
jgi:hypothetical protein